MLRWEGVYGYKLFLSTCVSIRIGLNADPDFPPCGSGWGPSFATTMKDYWIRIRLANVVPDPDVGNPNQC
jgi:hypothetical protein